MVSIVLATKFLVGSRTPYLEIGLPPSVPDLLCQPALGDGSGGARFWVSQAPIDDTKYQ